MLKSTPFMFKNLNNYFRLHVCLSFRTYVRPYVTLYNFKSYRKMSLIKVSWYVLRVKNMHLKNFRITSWVFPALSPSGGARQCPRSGHFLVISKEFCRKKIFFFRTKISFLSTHIKRIFINSELHIPLLLIPMLVQLEDNSRPNQR